MSGVRKEAGGTVQGAWRGGGIGPRDSEEENVYARAGKSFRGRPAGSGAPEGRVPIPNEAQVQHRRGSGKAQLARRSFSGGRGTRPFRPPAPAVPPGALRFSWYRGLVASLGQGSGGPHLWRSDRRTDAVGEAVTWTVDLVGPSLFRSWFVRGFSLVTCAGAHRDPGLGYLSLGTMSGIRTPMVWGASVVRGSRLPERKDRVPNLLKVSSFVGFDPPVVFVGRARPDSIRVLASSLCWTSGRRVKAPFGERSSPRARAAPREEAFGRTAWPPVARLRRVFSIHRVVFYFLSFGPFVVGLEVDTEFPA